MVIINTQKDLEITSLFTEYQKLRENSEENYEFINAEIVKMYSPSKRHQDIVFGLAIELRKFFKNTKCTTMISPFDVYLETKDIKENQVVIPDISVMCDKSGFDEKRYRGVPTIIVEVLSSNWADDMIKKLKLYEKYGVKEYWIIDPTSKTFIIYNYDFEKKAYYNVAENNSNELHSKLFPDLIVNMKEIFEEE